MKKLIFLIMIFSTFNSIAQTAFSDKLRQIGEYDRLYEKVNSFSGDEQSKEFSDKFFKAVDEQKKLEADPNARAKLYYQKKVDASPCFHCPKYLDLVLEVNKIVEKTNVKDESISSANNRLIALTKLKFLYYVVKSNDNTNDDCRIYSQMIPGEESRLRSGKMNLAAEEALALPNVTDVQLHEGKGKEIHYYYRGEGEESGTIIEVVMKNDGSSIMRYYKYDSGFNLPDVGSKIGEIPVKEKGDNYVDISPSLETEKVVLATDFKLGTIGTKTQLTDDLNLKHQTEVSYNQQKTNWSVEDQEGKKYVAISGTNFTQGKKVVDAIVNYDFDLDKESKLKLGGSVGNTMEYTSGPKGELINKQSAKLGIVDKDNEYIQVRTFLDQQGVSTVGVGNKFKAGDGAIGTDAQFDRDGTKTYSLKALDQGYLSEAGVNYKQSINGDRSYGAKVGAKFDDHLILSTEYSRSERGQNSYAVNFEKKISENTSMVLSVQNGSTGTNVMYQFQSKF